jgi:hypothetical protein
MGARCVGIVGSEAAKFTSETAAAARGLIRGIILAEPCDLVVSGECHLGGIDIWAREIAQELGVPFRGHPPKTRSWATGYKPRNLLIAQDSTECHCITIKEYPESYTGMRFSFCYHCGTADHVKSGGCWTVKMARQMGKPGEIHTV